LRAQRSAARGFTLIELAVTIALLVLLIGLGLPGFMTWIRNTQVRSVADSLQTGIRQAQTDALRFNRSVVFYLTNNSPSPTVVAPAVANGRNWIIVRVPQFDDPTTAAWRFLTGGTLTDVASNVQVTNAAGSTSMCFNANGRVADNATPGVAGAVCTAGAKQFDISQTGGDRRLRVLVAIGGQVRMCDPDRPTLSATSPDGCP
jgi:type IV fimbrial biogenesis protein FimT